MTKRGRQSKYGIAMSGAERAKAFRVRQKAMGLKRTIISNIPDQLLGRIRREAAQSREADPESENDDFSDLHGHEKETVSSVIIRILENHYGNNHRNSHSRGVFCEKSPIIEKFMDEIEDFLLDTLAHVRRGEGFAKKNRPRMAHQ